MMKRMLSVVLCLMMVIACFAGVAVSADEVEYVAGLGLVASDWSTNTDFRENSSVTTTVTGSGTYTLNYEGTCKDLGILVVDIVGAAAAWESAGKTYEVTNVTLTIDGNNVPVNMSKLRIGNLENAGNFRIELQNMYGDTKDDPALDTSIAVEESLVLTFTLTCEDDEPETTGTIENTEESNETNATETKPTETNPKSGDGVAVVAALLVTAAMGTAIVLKKKEI